MGRGSRLRRREREAEREAQLLDGTLDPSANLNAGDIVKLKSDERKSTIATIRELEGAVRGFVNLKKCVMTDMQNPELVERDALQRRKIIENQLRAIKERSRHLTDGYGIVDECNERIAELMQRVKKLKHRYNIEELMRLTKIINSQGQGIDLDAAEQLLKPASQSLDPEVDAEIATDMLEKLPEDVFTGEAFDGEPELSDMPDYSEE